MSYHADVARPLRDALNKFEKANRATGRTTRMIENLQDGDLVCFAHTVEARRVERLCKDAGLRDIKVAIIEPRIAERDMLDKLRGSSRRVVLDHGLVDAIAAARIDYIEHGLTGFLVAINRHVKPRRMTTKTFPATSPGQFEGPVIRGGVYPK